MGSRARAAYATVCLWGIVFANIAGAQTVSIWLTTPDQQSKLQQQASVDFTAAAAATNPVMVDETEAYQQIEGFGGSFTDTSAYLLNEVLPADARTTVMTNLFTRAGDGIGLSFVRNPMGASDFSRSVYSYDDQPAGPTDPNLTGFSIQHDLADIVPLVQQALQLNPQLKIMANPWSPPGWMKTSGLMLTGTLRTDMYAPFANYFVKYIQAYAANGIPVHYISLQNEPLYEPTSYPGMLMDAPTQVTVLRDYVLPALTANHLTTRVLVYDHNWDRPDYPDQVLSDAVLGASDQVAGVAWHGYGGTPGAMTTLAGKYPTKGNYLTEHSGGTWISNQLKSDFEEITQVMRSWGRAYVKWNLALDQNRGPTFGGASTCYPLVTVNSANGTPTYTIEYYTLGHFSKFVLPGAWRVFSTNGTGVVSAAFANPDGSKVLVAYNDSAASQTFQVRWGGRQFTYTLPASAAATFTWAGTQSGSYTLDATLPIRASSFNATLGLQTETTADTLGGYDVGFADNNDYAAYRNVDFGSGVDTVSARVASASNGGTLEFRLDSPTGPRIASLALSSTGGWQSWQTVTGSVSGASGVRDVYLVFVGGSSIANLNWFQFSWTSLAPRIASSLPNQTVTAGNPASFTVAASGTPTLQWQRQASGSGAFADLGEGGGYAGTMTTTLTISGTATGMSGDQFRCVATNNSGVAVSNAATLTVNPVPVVNAISYNATTFPATATVGANLSFTCNVTNTGTNTWGPDHIVWLRDANNNNLSFASLNGVAPGASMTVTLQLTAPASPGSYTYYVQGLENNVAWFNAKVTLNLVVNAAAAGTGFTADFNGDGKADILWSNTTSGDRYLWLMNGGSVTDSIFVGTVPAQWLATTGDFNGDGKADLLWSNTASGDRYLWLMNGGSVTDSIFLGAIATQWTPAIGDFDGDGKADILWSNTSSGDRYLWLMNGGSVIASVFVGTVATPWTPATGDFDGDGKADILWSNTSSGDRYLWLMNGGSVAASIFLGTVATPWAPVIGDFNGDGKADILWSNTSSGDRYLWLMNGGSVAASIFLGTVATPWAPAIGDFNGDAKADILWSNTSSGDRYLWLMNGGSVTNSIFLSTVAPQWQVGD